MGSSGSAKSATDRLVEDLWASVNISALARRQFLDIARIAGRSSIKWHSSRLYNESPANP
jgi:hypothetical protein